MFATLDKAAGIAFAVWFFVSLGAFAAATGYLWYIGLLPCCGRAKSDDDERRTLGGGSSEVWDETKVDEAPPAYKSNPLLVAHDFVNPAFSPFGSSDTTRAASKQTGVLFCIGLGANQSFQVRRGGRLRRVTAKVVAITIDSPCHDDMATRGGGKLGVEDDDASTVGPPMILSGPPSTHTLEAQPEKGSRLGFGMSVALGANLEVYFVVESIVPGSAAEVAGLSPGTVLTAINGEPLDPTVARGAASKLAALMAARSHKDEIVSSIIHSVASRGKVNLEFCPSVTDREASWPAANGVSGADQKSPETVTEEQLFRLSVFRAALVPPLIPIVLVLVVLWGLGVALGALESALCGDSCKGRHRARLRDSPHTINLSLSLMLWGFGFWGLGLANGLPTPPAGGGLVYLILFFIVFIFYGIECFFASTRKYLSAILKDGAGERRRPQPGPRSALTRDVLIPSAYPSCPHGLSHDLRLVWPRALWQPSKHKHHLAVVDHRAR